MGNNPARSGFRDLELERRRRAYRGLRRPVSLEDRVVILVDDGLATGVTMAAAPGGCRTLEYFADAVVTGLVPDMFRGIARSYETFGHTSEDEVARLLAASGRDRRGIRPSPSMPLAWAADLAGTVAAA